MSVLYCPYLGTTITDGQRRMKRGGGGSKQLSYMEVVSMQYKN
jgi:hypothetical protein